MRTRGLLAHANLDGIETRDLSPEEQAIAWEEYGTLIVLERLAKDKAFRSRVRAYLRDLPVEDKPGPQAVMSDKVVYELVKALQSHGNTLTKCYDLLAREGLTAISIKRKFKRHRSKSTAKG